MKIKMKKTKETIQKRKYKNVLTKSSGITLIALVITIIILIIFQIVSMIFVIYGLAHNNKNSTETYLNSFEEIIKLKNEHFISDEEYEKRKQEILKNLK